MPSRFYICLLCVFPALAVAAAEERLQVSVRPYSELVFYPSRSAPATVISLNNSEIPAEITSRIVKIPVRVGDRVEKGELLAQLDCRESRLSRQIEQARLDQLEAALALDQRDLSRREKLHAGGNIGEADLDRSRTEVQSKQSQLEAQQALLGIAELNVQRCEVRAPYRGVVAARLASEGENLSVGQGVMALVQLDALEVLVSIAVDDVASFINTAAYQFQTDGSSYDLRLRTLVPLVEINARVREARLNFVDKAAISGSSGRVVWRSPHAHVPARFLQLRAGKFGIFVADDSGKARFIVVDDAEEGRPVPFDMPVDTRLITDGRFGLQDGQPISVQ